MYDMVFNKPPVAAIARIWPLPPRPFGEYRADAKQKKKQTDINIKIVPPDFLLVLPIFIFSFFHKNYFIDPWSKSISMNLILCASLAR